MLGILFLIDKKSCQIYNEDMTRKVVKAEVKEMPLYNNLKQAREVLSISQTELGKRCGVSRQTISSIERGDYHPSIALSLKIAKIFDKSVEELFWLEEEEHEKL